MSNKMPAYRLQLVLEQRENEKKKAEEALAETQRALREEKKKLEALEEQRREVEAKKAKATEDFHAAMEKPGCNIGEEADRHDWYQKAMDAEIARIDGEIQSQKQAIRRAEQRVEDARMELAKKAMELQAMEKHKEKWLKEAKRELAEKEQMQQEEIGESMWLAQRRDAERRTTGEG